MTAGWEENSSGLCGVMCSIIQLLYSPAIGIVREYNIHQQLNLSWSCKRRAYNLSDLEMFYSTFKKISLEE